MLEINNDNKEINPNKKIKSNSDSDSGFCIISDLGKDFLENKHYEEVLALFGRSVLKSKNGRKGSEYYSTAANGDCGWIAIAQCLELAEMKPKERSELLRSKQNDKFRQTSSWGIEKGKQLRETFVENVQNSQELYKPYYNFCNWKPKIPFEKVYLYRISADNAIKNKDFLKKYKFNDEELEEAKALTKNGEDRQPLWFRTVHFAILSRIFKKNILVLSISKDKDKDKDSLLLHINLYQHDMDNSNTALKKRRVNSHDVYLSLPKCVFHKECLVVIHQKNHFWFAYLNANHNKSDEDYLEELSNNWKTNPLNLEHINDLV